MKSLALQGVFKRCDKPGKGSGPSACQAVTPVRHVDGSALAERAAASERVRDSVWQHLDVII